MKKFVNTIIEKAKAALARLKGLIRKSGTEAAEEAPEAEPSAVKKVVTVVGMCALVGIVAFVAGNIVVDLRDAIDGACLWVCSLAYLLGWLPRGAVDAIRSVVFMLDYTFAYRLIWLAIAALVAVVAYICSIIKSAHDNDCTVSDCARRDLNRVVNYCKNHPYKVLWFVLVYIIACLPSDWCVLHLIRETGVGVVRAACGDVVGASFVACSFVVESVMLIAALVGIRM